MIVEGKTGEIPVRKGLNSPLMGLQWKEAHEPRTVCAVSRNQECPLIDSKQGIGDSIPTTTRR